MAPSSLHSVSDIKHALLDVVTPTRSGAHSPVADNAGYTDTVFEGKSDQAAQVKQLLSDKGFIPPDLVAAEVTWFYQNLGIDDTYFALESVETVADHILALFGAKIMAYTKHSSSLDIDLEKESDTGAVFIHSSQAGKSHVDGPQWEKRIDAKYLDKSSVEKAYRLETYRSAGSVSAASQQQLRCYFLAQCDFVEPRPSAEQLGNIRAVSDKTFLSKATPNTLEIYQDVMDEVLRRQGPVIEMFEVEGSRERRIVIGYRMGTTSSFFSALSDLYHFYGLFSSRKYVEQFSNNVTIISIYLNPVPGSSSPPIEHSIHQVMKEASLIYVLPDNPFFQPALAENTHAVQEATYAYVGWLFAQHFCNRLGQAYQSLRNILNENDAQQAAILNDIKLRFREETFTRQSIQDVIETHSDLIRLLYVHFANIHYPGGAEDQDLVPTLSYQRLVKEEVLDDNQMYDRIRKAANNSHERQVLEAFLFFNKAVLKTNFYTPTKVALSFRLDPGFLPEVEYPVKPYGIIFVVGAEFRGFHVRFKDVARGGIRIVRSRNRENYSINQRTLFDENYALAFTQNLKNKDIPEGGAKGIILPVLDANPRLAFEKYIDAIIDLLLPGKTPGVKEQITDLLGKEEILFLGPDEGTADLMDYAAFHAKERGAPWWKSFTTGKSAARLGGVPHDKYAMTTRSVREYVFGINRMLGLNEKEITKIQTGGPDGDLGSNEILLSTDKTVAIIDGSGVIYDPAGLDRTELVRLAKARKTIAEFATAKLGAQGYRVLVEENDVKLPSGEMVPDGVAFRNTAHLRFKADLFVPCGGRPESINVGNVAQLFDEDGKPNFKYLVEGANLFVTRQARLELEKRGVILYPDASANKGGVTSSSLEVLCGLGLSDSEYASLMLYQDEEPTPFYLSYVRDIQTIISRNAAAEFDAIWRENAASGKPRSTISTELSSTLNKLSDELESTKLFDNVELRNAVLTSAFPSTLVRQVGLDTLIARVPEAYVRSAFAATVAAGFVYSRGGGASHVDFYDYISGLKGN